MQPVNITNSTATLSQTSQKILDANVDRKFLSILNTSGADSVLVKFGADFITPVNEVQKITFTPAAIPSAGGFKLQYGATKTIAITYDQAASDVQAALRSITGLEAVTVAGDFENGFTVTFAGDEFDATLLVVTDNTLVTDVSRTDEVQLIVFSAAPTAGTFKVKFGANKTAAIAFDDDAAAVQTALRLVTGLEAVVVEALIDVVGFKVTFTGSHADAAMLEVTDSTLTDNTEIQDEVQTIFVNALPTEGTFKLQFGAQITAELAYSATSTQIQTALRALSNISNDTTVAGTDLVTGMAVTFTGTDGSVDQPALQPYLVDLKRHGEMLRMDVYETTKGSAVSDVTATVSEETKGVGDLAESGAGTTITAGVAYHNEGIPIAPGKEWKSTEVIPTDEVWAKCEGTSVELAIMEG